MLTLPRNIERNERPYVAIPASVTMAEIGSATPRLTREIWTWVADRRVKPAEGSIVRYRVVDMDGMLEVECGVPLEAAAEGDGAVIADVLPAGRYASVTWKGPYDALLDVNAVLVGWARERGLELDVAASPQGDRFGCRLEIFRSDPVTVPDPNDWETEVAIRLRD